MNNINNIKNNKHMSEIYSLKSHIITRIRLAPSFKFMNFPEQGKYLTRNEYQKVDRFITHNEESFDTIPHNIYRKIFALPNEITIYIEIDLCNTNKWNDIDYIVVIDDDFGQPFTPFYTCLKKESDNEVPTPNGFTQELVKMYNEKMQNLCNDGIFVLFE